MKILIIKISSLGDVIHTFALSNALHRSVKDISIDWVVSDAYADLVQSVEGVNRVWKFRRSEWGKNWWKPGTAGEVAAMVRGIRAERYNLCLDLQGLFRSGLLTFLSGAEKKAGFSNAREGARYFYGDLINPGEKPHAVDILFSAMELFNLPPPKETDFSFPIPQESRSAVTSDLTASGIGEKYLVFHAGGRWPTKLWPLQFWRELAGEIHKKFEMPIVFTGSADDRRMVEEITKGIKGTLNTAGRYSLTELAALLKNAALAVTVDSGPMHLAAAFSTPLIALFGPTSPDKTGPRSKNAAETVSVRMDCVPCLKRECRLVGSGRDAECMNRIKPSQIKSRALKILE